MANFPTDYDELTAPADGDKILVNDVSETTVGKKIKWWTNTGLKAFLKTYFDTLYLAITNKAAGSDVDTGTNDTKYVTAKAIKDSANVPSVAPGTSGNVLTSNGAAWTSAAASAGGVISGPGSFMDNGVITVSVASNNLTVAIKTIAGADPSAGDPVKVRIGNVYRSITAALSVTKNAGTNWFASGAAPLATKEIDYFVYIGYNATDGVTIGFSRIPYANLYSEFSATSTNEKYCAISTITNAAAGDNYVNVGRFAATLSAGAGYTWTVPTFTAINLIQRPIYETRWLTWAATITGFSSNPTFNTMKYKIEPNRCTVSIATLAAGTSNATGFTFSSPISADSDAFFPVAIAQNNSAATYQAMVGVSGGTITLYNAGSPSGWTNLGTKYADLTFPFLI